jgi:hypothetical protein
MVILAIGEFTIPFHLRSPGSQIAGNAFAGAIYENDFVQGWAVFGSCRAGWIWASCKEFQVLRREYLGDYLNEKVRYLILQEDRIHQRQESCC